MIVPGWLVCYLSYSDILHLGKILLNLGGVNSSYLSCVLVEECRKVEFTTFKITASYGKHLIVVKLDWI